MWLPQRLAALGSEAAESTLNMEERECRELLAALGAAFAGHRGPIVFLDLHTTSAEGIPFAIVADTLLNRRLALSISAPVILGLEEQLDGTTLNYMNDRGYAAVGFEGGQNEAPSSIDHNEAALWTILVATGCLREDSMEQAASARAALAARTRGVPRILEVRYRHAIEPADEFVMEPGYVSFQPVKRGEVLGRDRRGPVRAAKTRPNPAAAVSGPGLRRILSGARGQSAMVTGLGHDAADADGTGTADSSRRASRSEAAGYANRRSEGGALDGARFLPFAGLSPTTLRRRQNRRQPTASRRRFAGAMVASNHLIEQRIVDHPAAPLARPDHVDKVGVPAHVGDLVGVMREHGL